MGRSGSLPYVILAAVICTLFAIYLDSAFMSPTTEAYFATSVWQTNHQSFAYQGKQMVAGLARDVLIVITFAIWVGVLIEARRAA